jgi:phosphatidylcholine synthase
LTTIDASREPLVATRRLRAAGWALHLYTASGTVLALLTVSAAITGNTIQALWLMLAAMVVDGTDGALARRLRVKETIPGFDGARLDDIVDYITYAFAPIVLLWMGGYLPAGTLGAAVAAVPLLASCYQFCRSDAKTDDHCFLGFPSYWNVVAFYVVVVGLSPTTTGIILVVCSALVFVPIKYIYPSRTRAFRTANLAFTAGWLITYAVMLLQMPDPNALVLWLSVGYLLYYVASSVYLTLNPAPRSSRPGGDRVPAVTTGLGD